MIETEAVHIEGLDHEALLQFHAGSSLRTDFGNWYVPTIEALHNLCRAAGFSEVRTVVGPPPPRSAAAYRAGGCAWRAGSGGIPPPPPPSAPSENYRAIVHAVRLEDGRADVRPRTRTPPDAPWPGPRTRPRHPTRAPQ